MTTYAASLLGLICHNIVTHKGKMKKCKRDRPINKEGVVSLVFLSCTNYLTDGTAKRLADVEDEKFSNSHQRKFRDLQRFQLCTTHVE